LAALDAPGDGRASACVRRVSPYAEALRGLPLAPVFASPKIKENGYCAVAMIEPDKRPTLIQALKSAGVGYGTIYPGAMSLQSGAAGHLVGKIDHGNSHYISQAVLNLPCFAYMTGEELAYVCETVHRHFKN
jgi:UDP-2-acetamido-2-deoxy-ribo-hexuluronate aminotransferase